ncbi:hypothetical protein IS481_15235 [Caldimonas thermodepolymerans]|jgi:hypothetical protein|uniref:Uncharacterized protein n=1 Tax=Caldimonas thermodepolymerans TaxID=215580 RepID=A0A2S5T311_9BURK|nr:hypothetical protein [Caldimonas thermodepolymerans]PPE69346.1 hypothetical protein C1702_12685 [Caldimonas thermodepolymerans]QPC31073.1 hypothetical protein IS481_15235 [Caldimonas thermodepolymerans]RDH96199.1 hypothetical protein DES46_11120 [Caldimonas thermodepolymerans]TCP04119.1 hypothetical protein EV676_11120 [Caldimonas thermodepolymerans]UZG43797.1 hypothetical protein ONZ46_15625 [Caldimonas thermodepolymerans]
MIVALWIVFAVSALLWTGGTVLLSVLTRWLARAVASGEVESFGRSVAQWPVPDWVAAWIDPAVVQAAQRGVLWLAETSRNWLPWAGTALDWLVPLIWVVWALGLLGMLLVAAGVHLLARRLGMAAPR